MLILTFSGMEEGSLRRLSNLTDEYAQDILVGAERKAFIQEHGICILKMMPCSNSGNCKRTVFCQKIRIDDCKTRNRKEHPYMVLLF